jgi:hypothetical protein
VTRIAITEHHQLPAATEQLVDRAIREQLVACDSALIKSGTAARRPGGASRAALGLGGPSARARRPARRLLRSGRLIGHVVRCSRPRLNSGPAGRRMRLATPTSDPGAIYTDFGTCEEDAGRSGPA